MIYLITLKIIKFEKRKAIYEKWTKQVKGYATIKIIDN